MCHQIISIFLLMQQKIKQKTAKVSFKQKHSKKTMLL